VQTYSAQTVVRQRQTAALVHALVPRVTRAPTARHSSTPVRTIRALTPVNAMQTAAPATPAHASPDFRAPTARLATRA